MNPLETTDLEKNQHLANPLLRLPEGCQPSSNDDFFPDAKGLSIHQGTFTNTRGDVVYSIKQSSLVCSEIWLTAENWLKPSILPIRCVIYLKSTSRQRMVTSFLMRRSPFYCCTFNTVRGDMIIHPQADEQPSLVRMWDLVDSSRKLTGLQWNKYRWVDFDQQTLRYLRSNSKGIVTMEMEPMVSTSRIKVCRIHYYKDKEDLFYRHLEFSKSLYVLFSCIIILWMLSPDLSHEDWLAGEGYHSFLEHL